MEFSKEKRKSSLRENCIKESDLENITFKKILRDKKSHSCTGIANFNGTDIFVKKYINPSNPTHFDVEISVLDRLHSDCDVNFFVDYLGFNRKSQTIAFPLLEEDVSSYGTKHGLSKNDIYALGNLISFEIEQMQKIKTEDLPLKTKEPFYFIQKLSKEGIIDSPRMMSSPELHENSVIMRYDPQIDNFMLLKNEVYSTDFSMLRVMHKCYPFGYILHNLIEHPRINLDPTIIQKHICEYIESNRYFYSPKCRLSIEQIILFCRAEALAYSYDWNTRRGFVDEAKKRLTGLNKILENLNGR